MVLNSSSILNHALTGASIETTIAEDLTCSIYKILFYGILVFDVLALIGVAIFVFIRKKSYGVKPESIEDSVGYEERDYGENGKVYYLNGKVVGFSGKSPMLHASPVALNEPLTSYDKKAYEKGDNGKNPMPFSANDGMAMGVLNDPLYEDCRFVIPKETAVNIGECSRPYNKETDPSPLLPLRKTSEPNVLNENTREKLNMPNNQQGSNEILNNTTSVPLEKRKDSVSKSISKSTERSRSFSDVSSIYGDFRVSSYEVHMNKSDFYIAGKQYKGLSEADLLSRNELLTESIQVEIESKVDNLSYSEEVTKELSENVETSNESDKNEKLLELKIDMEDLSNEISLADHKLSENVKASENNDSTKELQQNTLIDDRSSYSSIPIEAMSIHDSGINEYENISKYIESEPMRTTSSIEFQNREQMDINLKRYHSDQDITYESDKNIQSNEYKYTPSIAEINTRNDFDDDRIRTTSSLDLSEREQRNINYRGSQQDITYESDKNSQSIGDRYTLGPAEISSIHNIDSKAVRTRSSLDFLKREQTGINYRRSHSHQDITYEYSKNNQSDKDNEDKYTLDLADMSGHDINSTHVRNTSSLDEQTGISYRRTYSDQDVTSETNRNTPSNEDKYTLGIPHISSRQNLESKDLRTTSSLEFSKREQMGVNYIRSHSYQDVSSNINKINQSYEDVLKLEGDEIEKKPQHAVGDLRTESMTDDDEDVGSRRAHRIVSPNMKNEKRTLSMNVPLINISTGKTTRTVRSLDTPGTPNMISIQKKPQHAIMDLGAESMTAGDEDGGGRRAHRIVAPSIKNEKRALSLNVPLINISKGKTTRTVRSLDTPETPNMISIEKTPQHAIRDLQASMTAGDDDVGGRRAHRIVSPNIKNEKRALSLNVPLINISTEKTTRTVRSLDISETSNMISKDKGIENDMNKDESAGEKQMIVVQQLPKQFSISLTVKKDDDDNENKTTALLKNDESSQPEDFYEDNQDLKYQDPVVVNENSNENNTTPTPSNDEFSQPEDFYEDNQDLKYQDPAVMKNENSISKQDSQSIKMKPVLAPGPVKQGEGFQVKDEIRNLAVQSDRVSKMKEKLFTSQTQSPSYDLSGENHNFTQILNPLNIKQVSFQKQDPPSVKMKPVLAPSPIKQEDSFLVKDEIRNLAVQSGRVSKMKERLFTTENEPRLHVENQDLKYQHPFDMKESSIQKQDPPSVKIKPILVTSPVKQGESFLVKDEVHKLSAESGLVSKMKEKLFTTQDKPDDLYEENQDLKYQDPFNNQSNSEKMFSKTINGQYEPLEDTVPSSSHDTGATPGTSNNNDVNHWKTALSLLKKNAPIEDFSNEEETRANIVANRNQCEILSKLFRSTSEYNEGDEDPKEGEDVKDVTNSFKSTVSIQEYQKFKDSLNDQMKSREAPKVHSTLKSEATQDAKDDYADRDKKLQELKIEMAALSKEISAADSASQTQISSDNKDLEQDANNYGDRNEKLLMALSNEMSSKLKSKDSENDNNSDNPPTLEVEVIEVVESGSDDTIVGEDEAVGESRRDETVDDNT